MATNRYKDTGEPQEWRDDPFGGFDVTCVIGHVSLDPAGATPAHVAAFSLIAEHDAPGSYRFPMADGRTCLVDVSWEGEAR